MKIGGWILLVLGVLSTIGSFIGGNSPTGGIFFTVLGAYLISRANKKKKEEEDRNKWINNK